MHSDPIESGNTQKMYSGKFRNSFKIPVKYFIQKIFCRRLIKYTLIALSFFLFQIIRPFKSYSQQLQFSYSYVNLSRNTTGGTLEQGDTIEVHALAKVNATTNNFYYMDTIRTGMQFVANSFKLITNEGVLFTGSGPFTNITNDDNGVYDATIPGIRINIGTSFSNALSGVGFGNATGGGQVAAGSVPKFYGSTLFLVSYKLLITANYGDTIYPTGNYYFDTSGVTQTYRFTYPGIKIIQNQGLCTNFSSSSFSAESSFNSGNVQNRTTGAIVPGYVKVNMGANAPQDNYYAIANNTSANGTTNNAGAYAPTANANRVFGGYWDIIGDHTGSSNQQTGNLPPAAGSTGGYMLVVNAAFTTGEAYRDTIKNICPNTYYEFSAWIRNICGVCGINQNSTSTYTPGVLPNLSYTINDVDYYTTGDMTHDTIWEKRGFIYKTGPTETQFRITIKNNAPGGGGNDWVLDDIKLATCYPSLINSPKDTASACAGYPISLSDTVKSYFNSYNYYCWEKSSDGVNWTSTGVCGVKTPVLVNGNWQYVVDTTFYAVAADSGKYYQLKVATTFANLSNSVCAVANSQKIFLKVYNVSCATLDAQVLNFSGIINNDKANLKWTSQNQGNLKTYQIERSIDGINFSQIGVVVGTNDINEVYYSFNDPEAVASIVYYRLKLSGTLDIDNKYSKIIALYNKNANLKVTAVNPFKTSLKMNVFLPGDGQTDFYLFDVFGNTISKKSMRLTKGNTQIFFGDLGNLSPGMYILSTKFNNAVVQNRLFKVE